MTYRWCEYHRGPVADCDEDDIELCLTYEFEDDEPTCRCGWPEGLNWFDRSICPCGSMHTRCQGCGGTYGECPFEEVPVVPVVP